MKMKKLAATVLAIMTMSTGTIGLSASALTNRYSTFNPYKSGSNVYFGVEVTNTSGSVSSFSYYGALYNNVSGSQYGATTSIVNQTAVGNGLTVSVRGLKSYSNMPDQTRCENHVASFYGATIPTYGTPYETYVNNSYFNK